MLRVGKYRGAPQAADVSNAEPGLSAMKEQ
jgi:hypothetical protein